MTNEQTKKILDAAEVAKVSGIVFVTDIPTRLYKNKNSIIKYLEDQEMVVNIRSNSYSGSIKTYGDGGIEVVMADISDVHEIQTGGNYDQVKTFLENIGVNLEEDELTLMINIDKSNSDIIPITEDYVHSFHYLSKKQIAELDPEEKAEYEAALAKFEKEKREYLAPSSPVSVSLGI